MDLSDDVPKFPEASFAWNPQAAEFELFCMWIPGKAQAARLELCCLSDSLGQESVLRSQSADVEVACGQHAMIQPLQRNWCWFHEQREQRAHLYLHSLKVSQLEKELQEQRERCKMLSAELENANNLHRTSLKSLKDVLEETVLRWKNFGIPECDVEVHATEGGQFLPPMYSPMTPPDSNNLKAKDRADSIKKKERLSDASTIMRNASMGTRGRRKPTSLFFLRKRTKWGKCIYQLKAEKPQQLKACSSSRQNELDTKPMQIAESEDESECQTSKTKIPCQSTEESLEHEPNNSSTEQCANAYAAAWKTAEGRPEMSIWHDSLWREIWWWRWVWSCATQVAKRGVLSSLWHGYTFWHARCRFRTRGDRIQSVPSIDQTARWQCWEWIRIPANRVVPTAFRPSPSERSG